MDAALKSSVLPPTMAWLGRIRIAHIMALGLFARLLVFAIYPDQHFGDAHVYVDTGHALATTGFMSSPFYMPLYPLWTWVWGGAWGVKIGDILISTATLWLIWKLADIIVRDRTVALVAAAAAAVYPYFLFYAVSGLTETAFIFLLLASCLCFYQRRFLGGSALFVLTILVRPTLDLLAPFLITAFVIITHRGSIRETAYRIGQYACIYIVLMTPWWIDNYVHYGTFVRLDLADGIVLYSGNNPLNTSGGGIIGSDVDLTPFDSITDPVKRDEALKNAAWGFIESHPKRVVELAGVKFLRFWRLWPYAAEYDKPWTMAASVLSYGVLLGCSIIYLAMAGPRNWRPLSPVLLLTAYLTLVHTATIASIRYRFPLEPFIVILGSAGLLILVRAGYDYANGKADP